ncbi:hypothetical protein IGI04_029793 [Brassica rapa subsp. trilocularis]|uniref:Uncharacterized protein n=1 Tax=Brassica rapa subsp. trilocularis TaxID=1813537 RepID=A0ABQ7LNZ2_BRACM|nr:hypothetical protein IGI04_029793 [Brassica rapa subsp. trilocularis]
MTFQRFLVIGDAQRPRQVAPARRSRLRERPRWVAARGRSESDFVFPRTKMASDFSLSLCDLMPSLREVAPGSACPKTTLITSFELQMHPNVSRNSIDLMPSLREVASGSARPKTTLITSFELQMHPNVSRNSMWYSNT